MARDAHHIIRVLLHHVRVGIHQGRAHAVGGFLIRAEHDGARHGVRSPQVGGDALRHLADAVGEHDVGVVVPLVVDAVLDGVAEVVPLVLHGPPAVADVELHLDDAERSQEAVLDALVEAVDEEGLAEIADVGLLCGLLGRGRHADLRGGGEVLENTAPAAVCLRGAPVALVYDDEVKEIGREEFVLLRQGRVLVLLLAVGIAAGELLVEAEVDLVGSQAVAVIAGEVDLVHHGAERREVLLDGLVHQEVAIRQVEHAVAQAAAQQSPHDLESRVGFARTRGHHQQQATPPGRNGIQRAVDSHALVIARRVHPRTAVVRLVAHLRQSAVCLGLLRRSQPLVPVPGRRQARQQLLRCGEVLHGQGTLLPRQVIMLGEAGAVAAVGKGHIQHLRILHGLLQAVRYAVGVVLGLHHRQGVMRPPVEDVIRLLALAAGGDVALDVHLAIREADLHGDEKTVPLTLQCGRNQQALHVFLAHALSCVYGLHGSLCRPGPPGIRLSYHTTLKSQAKNDTIDSAVVSQSQSTISELKTRRSVKGCGGRGGNGEGKPHSFSRRGKKGSEGG